MFRVSPDKRIKSFITKRQSISNLFNSGSSIKAYRLNFLKLAERKFC